MRSKAAICEVITPEITGVNLTDGSIAEGQQLLKGGPSVLYDAVALIFGATGGEKLAEKPEARDFVADAFAHCKFIAFTPEASPLLAKAGVAEAIDEGMIEICGANKIAQFVDLLGQLRLWKREDKFSD